TFSPPLSCRVLTSLFLNDTSTTHIYTLSLHDALPICPRRSTSSCTPSGSFTTSPVRRNGPRADSTDRFGCPCAAPRRTSRSLIRSEEHTSELQSLRHLVCRLLLEKKKKIKTKQYNKEK